VIQAVESGRLDSSPVTIARLEPYPYHTTDGRWMLSRGAVRGLLTDLVDEDFL
jgi:hypothetical protein